MYSAWLSSYRGSELRNCNKGCFLPIVLSHSTFLIMSEKYPQNDIKSALFLPLQTSSALETKAYPKNLTYMRINCLSQIMNLELLQFAFTLHLACIYNVFPKVLEHLLWFMLQTSYKIPSPLKQCYVKEMWIILNLVVMYFCITKGFRYRLSNVWRGEGVCTPIGETKKAKEWENR